MIFKKDIIYFSYRNRRRFYADVQDTYHWLLTQNKKVAEKFWEKAEKAFIELSALSKEEI